MYAEVLPDGRGEGVVQFTSAPSAGEAIARFNGYLYGGLNLGESGAKRPGRAESLTSDVQYNPRWHEFGPGAVRGGEVEAV